MGEWEGVRVSELKTRNVAFLERPYYKLITELKSVF